VEQNADLKGGEKNTQTQINRKFHDISSADENK
jgi:hypothetical protein